MMIPAILFGTEYKDEFAGGAFRVIEAVDTSYTQTDLYYRLTDHLGSTTLITDDTGLKVEGSEALYGPFGELRQEPTTTLTDFGYTGQRLDSSTGGLMFYGARYYLPELKRFISADTVVPSAYDSQALNRYSYVMNNPVKLIDPLGHIPERSPMIDNQIGIQTPYHTPQEVVEIITNRDLNNSISQVYDSLDEFGISIAWTHETDRQEELSIISTVLNVVNDFGDSLLSADPYDRIYIPNGWGPVEIFQAVFGNTNTLTIVPGINGLFGINHDGGNIELANDPMIYGGHLTTDNTYSHRLVYIPGEHLVGHELSHNLTYDGYCFNIHNNNWKKTRDYANEFLHVNVGEYAYGIVMLEEYGYQDEITADAITSWGLGLDDGGRTTQWMAGVVWEILSNQIGGLPLCDLSQCN